MQKQKNRENRIPPIKQIAFVVLVVSIMSSCNDKITEEFNPTAEGEIKNIKEIRTTMPHAKGFDSFETYCIACHSLRYIQMQPDFPEKKWQSIVDKMVRTFGAPIPDSTAKEIVAYFAEVKGTE